MQSSLNKATHQQTKTFNRQLVLRAIYDAGTISRAEIARLTKLTKVSVSDIVAELIENGLVAEVGLRPSASSAGGKSSIMLSVIDDSYHMIGIELASSELRGAIVNLRGEVRHYISQPLVMQDGSVPLDQFYALLEGLIPLTDRPLLGIGVGTPGVIDSTGGIVRQAVNVGWENVPLGRILNERYHLPVYLANDSQVSALAEHTFGAGRGANNLAVVLAGVGIAAGIIINNQLYLGDDFGAGEIGHMLIRPNGLLCRCGRIGCLETVAGSVAIIRRATELARKHPESLLGRRLTQVSALALEDVITSYQGGDEDACVVLREAGEAMGYGIACLISALNIHRVLLVGSVTRFGESWLQIVDEEVRRCALPALVQDMQIAFGEIYPHAVILGACALLMNREIGFSLAR
jgi:N-acetylglucosamine repressor